jgi:hypothetical protein
MFATSCSASTQQSLLSEFVSFSFYVICRVSQCPVELMQDTVLARPTLRKITKANPP